MRKGPGGPRDRRRGSELAFEPSSGELAGPSGAVRLAPQPASLLGLLLERRGEVVTRDEIVGRLWPGGKVEFDHGIAFAVREIRKALEAAGHPASLVETIPRRGYRLRATVASPSPGGRVLGTRSRARWAAAVGAAATVGVGLVLLLPARPPIVAIVEHEAIDGGDVARIARALGSSLTTVLTDSLTAAGVVGPTATASLAGPDDLEGARSELGACVVVSGSVSRAGSDAVVVFTQMVRTSDRVHVWARLDTVSAAEAVRSVTSAVLSGARDAVRDC